MMKRPILIFSAVLADLFIVTAVFPVEKTPSQEPKESIARPAVVYKAGERDPFQSPLTAAKLAATPVASGATEGHALPSLTVQGLVWGGNLPQAIVNNKVVKVGDTINGARVISIDKNGVTVFFEGRQYRLPSPAASAGPSKKP